jgi:predicted O-linked N-acetylglucosamine transferase (SPINDLY family)
MTPAQLQRLLQEAFAHHQAGRLLEADTLYHQARKALPSNFEVLRLSGILALQQGRAADAVDLLAKAHQVDPKDAECAMHLGAAYLMAGHRKEAEVMLHKAVRLNPRSHEGWDKLAYYYKVQDRLREAIECHKKAITLKPDYAAGWFNYGLTLSFKGQPTEALRCHDRALQADPDYAQGHYGRAQVLQHLNCPVESVEAYDRFLAKEPSHLEARSYRLFTLNYLERLTREQLFAEHVEFGRLAGVKPAPAFPHPVDPGRRLRVAFLSPDLRLHSCAYFLEPLLQHLDREQFEIYLYHDHFREDEVSQRLKALAAVWRRFVGLSGSLVREAILADRPDIVIDLAGHASMTNRLPLFAQHLAPVQITYLGYPNTTGLPAMGYRFTDAVADPPGEADAFATEKLVRFSSVAWTYQPHGTAPPVAPAPCTRGAPVTFGCFNTLGKITDGMLRLWGRVMQAVPESRLVLKGLGLSEAAAREQYQARFIACGLPPERIALVERTAGVEEHLSLYHQVDIALDTAPYGGTTTTCEALWMGVPVVTMQGDRHASRVGASLLTAIGHPEWIAPTPDDYLRIASELANDKARLAAARASLREKMRHSSLLDHAGQTRRFGEALRACWTEWCVARQPAAAAACA